jgi:small neutral amino acid transporter SnatA (MarC family)
MRIGVTLAGALLCSFWQYSRRAERLLTWSLATAIFASVIAAIVAFALADLNVLGIRIDTSQLTGYFVIGVMASYIGLDQMLERVMKKASGEKKRAAEGQNPDPLPVTP